MANEPENKNIFKPGNFEKNKNSWGVLISKPDIY
jgi:hypothetical protein